MLKRIARALIAMFFGQGISILSNVLLTPLFLHVWSPSVYGEWLAIFAATSYLINLDMGMQLYVVNRLTRAYAVGDLKEYRASADTAAGFYAIVASVGTAALALFAYLAPIDRWLNIKETSGSDVAVVVALLGAQLLWSLPAGFCQAIYRTTGDLTFSQWISNIGRMLTMLLTAVALIARPSMTAVAAVQLLPLLLTVLFVLWDVKKRFPALLPGFREARFDLLKQFLKPSLFFALIPVSMAIGLQGSTLLAASMLGTAAVALFVTTRTLANIVRQIVGLLSNAAWPDLTRLHAMADQSRLRAAFRMITAASVGGCIAVSASLWFEGADVIRVWTMGKLAPDETLLRLLLVQVALQSSWVAASVLLLAADKQTGLSVVYLAVAVGGLGLGALLMPAMGIYSLPMAFIAVELSVSRNYVLRNACNLVGERYREFSARLWTKTALYGASAGTAAFIAHQIVVLPAPARWILSLASCAIVVAAVEWLFCLSREERSVIRGKIAALLGRVETAAPETN